MIDLIIQLFTLSLVYWLYPGEILYVGITVDSLASASIFLKKYLFHSNTNSIVSDINTLYRLSIIDRYTYYLGLNALYYVISAVIWRQLPPVAFALLLTTCPMIMNEIHDRWLYPFFQMFQLERSKIFFIIISKQIAIGINHISAIFIDTNPEVSYLDILPLFQNYGKINIYDYVRNFVIVSLFNYVKENQYYARVFNMFYNYQTGFVIEELTETEIRYAKREVRDIIYRRKWDALFRPDIFNKIIYIYYQNNQNSNFIQVLLTYINYSMIKMFSIWSLCSLFGSVLLIPPVSMALILYRTAFKNWRVLPMKFAIRLIALLVAYVYPSYLLVSILSEFGYILIFNKVNQTILSYLYSRINKYIRIFQHYTRYNIYIAALTAYVIALMQIEVDCRQFYLTMAYIIVSNDWIQNILVATICGCGYLSGYDVYHIAVISVIYYVFASIGLYVSDKQRDNIFLNKLDVNIFDSYYNRGANDIQQEIITKPNKMNIIDNYSSNHKQFQTNKSNKDEVIITKCDSNLADKIREAIKETQ